MNAETDLPSLGARSLAKSALRPVALRLPAWGWAVAASCAALVPFAAGLSGSRIFYVRDLSLFFWGRFLWLRRTMIGGEWPLWDPYVGAGQSAVADTLHQMFLLPVLLIRLIGSEVLAFNLWVALPFPFAALGAWLFFARRFSPAAAALGSLAFSLSGPVVSTGNFPNMSWSVAAMPWVLWAVERMGAAPTARSVVVLAIAVAFQALAGEPVSFSATLALALAYALFTTETHVASTWRRRLRRMLPIAAGVALGCLLSAIQLYPMVEAASLAGRSEVIIEGIWSLHPLALVETVARCLFGDYYYVPSLASVPWLPLVNTGREPFFFSLYFGVPLFAVALFGLVATGRSSWSVFWAAAGGVSIVLAFGMYTPIYPFLQAHVPVLGSFRFPVKYLVVLSMAVAAGAAAGWETIAGAAAGTTRRARIDAVGFALAIAVAAGALAAACIYAPQPTAVRVFSLARALHADDGVAAAGFMLRVLPRAASLLMLLSLSTAVLLFVGTGRRVEAPAARWMCYLLVVGDLLLRSTGINPVFDPVHIAEPQWLSRTTADPGARFYVGGKKDGTLDVWDADAARGYLNPPGLVGSASRAALSGQSAFYPSAWHGREMLSYDLALLWPREFRLATDRFFDGTREARERFLDRTGVRYRVLPDRLAAGRAPIAAVPYFYQSSLYDWGADVAPRVGIVGRARIVADPGRQIQALFEDGWDRREVVIVTHEPEPAGPAGPAVAPFATITRDGANHVTVEAGAGSGGGYLVFLDSYSEDWTAAVDGQPAPLLRANGLFRAIRLAPGRHAVDFVYRPRAFRRGAWISGVSLAVILVLIGLPARRRP